MVFSVHAIQNQRVEITGVDYPVKTLAFQPFQINVHLHAFQPGGYIRVSLTSGGVSISNATSGTLLAFQGSDTSISMTLQLPFSEKPYEFDLLAYWDAILGGETLEDSSSISIQVVVISLYITGTAEPAISNSQFNVTFTIKNNGTDVAHDVTAMLTGLGGFGVIQNGTVDLGEIDPSHSENVTFTMISNPYDLVPGERQLTLSVSFFDWMGELHSTSANLAVYLQVSQSTISFWLPTAVIVLAFLVAIVLILMKKVRSVRVGAGGVTIRR